MRVPRVLLGAALICVAVLGLSSLASGQSDEAIAERVLGPQWKALAQRAGMIFTGTVVQGGAQTGGSDRGIQAIELSFRIERAIAGVERGQVLTIHEWTGALSRQRALRPGAHVLLFLYPPSRLGLTSPVGGPLGQIALDGSGQEVAAAGLPVRLKVAQLERAIRAARGE